ncbi:hypothetical protein BH79_14200 [Pseudomonas aeruginosa C0324C]|nr:hypothetical protein BH79_14200 [Pseudomonas aeruginosa C0324C]
MSLGLSHQRTNNYVEDTRLEDQSTRITEPSSASTMAGGSAAASSTSTGWQQGIGALGAQGRGHRRRAIRMRATTSTA